jgi:hypothetical protein
LNISKRRAQALVAVIALGFAVAAVFAALAPSRSINVPPLRSAQTPGLVAGAVVLTTFAALAALGLLVDRLLIFECAVLLAGYLVGNYASDSPYGLIVVVSVIALVVAFRVLRDRGVEIPPRRIALFGVSTLIGIAALWATHYQPRHLIWDRVRDGRANISARVFDGTCGTQPPHEVSSPAHDGGCGDFVPRPAALTAGVLCLGCVLLAALGASVGGIARSDPTGGLKAS